MPSKLFRRHSKAQVVESAVKAAKPITSKWQTFLSNESQKIFDFSIYNSSELICRQAED